MTAKLLLYWVLGVGSALFGFVWLLLETSSRAAEKAHVNDKLLIWLLGLGTGVLALGWEVFRLYLDQP